MKAIRETGMYIPVSHTRMFLLRGLGITVPPKPAAKNWIKLSCQMPFTHPRYVQGFFRLMDLLGVDYTYLEKEYCCGAQTISSATTDEERDRALKVSQALMQVNRDGARNKGAETMVYMCGECCHVAKAYFPEEADRHIYSWELIMDRLEDKALKIEPTVAGWFPTCGGVYADRALVSTLMKRKVGDIGWGRLRRMMSKIEGLTLVDLGKGLCCSHPRDNPGNKSIVQEAIDKGLDTIICPCHACRLHIDIEVKRRHIEGLQVKYLSDILLPALIGETAARELSSTSY